MTDECLIGQVERIIFQSNTNLYKVLLVKVDQEATSFETEPMMTLTGSFPMIHLETNYEFYGQIVTHPKYGEQFKVNQYQQVAPTSNAGLIEYLSSDRFKGIGTVLATRIVDTFGQEAIDIILNAPEKLKQIKGLTPKVRQSLHQALLAHQGTERIYMQLTQWGFGQRLIDKIYLTYKDESIEKITTNPYQLIEDIEGIGFQRADQLALQLDFEDTSTARLCAGIYTVVYQQTHQEGDTYVPKKTACQLAQRLLESSRRTMIELADLEEACDQMVQAERLMSWDNSLMLPTVYYAELSIVKKIEDYLKYEQVEQFESETIDAALDETIESIGVRYDQTQCDALRLAMNSPMSIITGGPGTGKTTLIRGLIDLHARLYDYSTDELFDPYQSKILLAAPTGRAAKRMQESSDGLPATTIHRLIGFTRESVIDTFIPQDLEGSLLIIDEMSMVDTWLMNWLMTAINYEMQIVFVGDQDQLPSVGPGNVFADLIQSQVIPTIKLNKIYRQAKDSSIIALAHAIRQGELPDDLLQKQADRSFIPTPSDQVVDVVSQIVHQAVERGGYDLHSLQVLAPMYRGPAGIDRINQRLQNYFNPMSQRERSINHFDHEYRVGDKVLQLVNNAEEDVYNGDIGMIDGIYTAEETESQKDEVVVWFDDQKELIYNRSELDQLTLAYCCSIHKAQGSEYPLVILPLVPSYTRMLRKDLLYTAVTRAQQTLILVGDPQSFKQAVTQEDRPRQTHLCEWLQLRLSEMQSEEESQEMTVVILSEETIDQIDPMIGMEGLSPYDFMTN